ncbi:MAG TPA: membrane dipeptidase [Gaiella sp.]|uniref:dipeptidase n=1 Tax=Gaiella sp. TaxID=2663207 RepID=UPI002D800721|nr:membrane dipeptidase [Gaiella sp.]HET9287239.1 membrane dipeptidase [Gaiella sp.]
MIADAHVDLLMELAYRERRLGETDVFARTWLPLLERGGVGLQVCPIYVDVVVQPEGSLREALSMVAAFQRAVRENGGRVLQVTSAADLDSVQTGERIGLVLALEGVECFGVETWPADVFHALGVRMAGLTWNRRNAFADGAAEDGGSLSRLGRELVDRLVSLGVVLDLAHSSRGMFTEILERAAGAPVLCSHGGCRSVYDTPRNLDDDQLRALADAGGIFGLMLHPIAIGPEQRTIDGVVDHLEHAVSVMGPERVCLGGDFTRRLWEAMPPPPEPKDGLMPPGLTPGLGIEGLVGSEDYPALVEGLDRRGWGAEEVAAVTSDNLLRFLRSSL